MKPLFYDEQLLEEAIIQRLKDTAPILRTVQSVFDERSVRDQMKTYPSAEIMEGEDSFNEPTMWQGPPVLEGTIDWLVFVTAHAARARGSANYGPRGTFAVKKQVFESLHGWEPQPGWRMYYRGSTPFQYDDDKQGLVVTHLMRFAQQVNTDQQDD